MVETAKTGATPLEGDGKRILLIVGSPKRKSFCHLLAECYAQGARSKDHVVRELKLGELAFDPCASSRARRRTGRCCAACSAPVASPPAAWKSSRRCAVPARNSARAGCVAPNSSAASSSSLPARLRPGADTDRSDRSATFPPASLPRPHGGPLPASTGSQCGCRPLCIPRHPSGMGSESDRPVTFGRDLKPAPRARISPLRNESGSGKKDLS